MLVVAGAAWAGLRFLGPSGEERDALSVAIDEVVEAAMEEGPISGVSVAVSRGFRVIHARGYGFADLENRLPATEQTVYHVGSITKQFTAAAVMQLVDDGVIRLDAAVTEYMPDYPEYAAVTVEQLLNHTAGVKNYTSLRPWWNTLGLETTPRGLAETFRDAPLDFEPGSRFAYSNSGYVVLGLILEAVADRPYGGLLNEKIFVPNALDATAYCDDRLLVENRAAGYQVVDGVYQHAPYISMSQAYAAGAVCSSVMDLLRWSRALSRGAVVSDAAYERMSSPSRLDDGSSIEYGFGLAVSYLEGHHRVNHVGGMLGFTGQMSHYDEDGITIAVLTNTEGANAAKIESDIARVLLGLGDRATRDIPLTASELAAYTGPYDLEITQVDVVAQDGRLQADVTLPGAEGRYVFLHQGDHTFQARNDSEIVVTFDMGDERATGFVLLRKGITMHARRIDD